ncbi:MAG TPA: helix-turn-helix domain-containing protein [Candidatus Manganitrophaceae bacterium]|nr:helix-turn-helix domain-containing protein [Candidatus Manganitrophaceae bacterium]
MAQDILLIHQDAELLAFFQKELEKNGTTVTPAKTVRIFAKNGSVSPSLVVIDAEGDWIDEIKSLQRLRKEGREFYTIISSAGMLKKTISQIHETALNLKQEKEGGRGGHKGNEPRLAELVENKLAVFVKKMKNHEGKNLYHLLIQEFEKPLITLALKETEGNQIQAAQLLGMNRNTLRKKIKELKIPIVKKKR